MKRRSRRSGASSLSPLTIFTTSLPYSFRFLAKGAGCLMARPMRVPKDFSNSPRRMPIILLTAVVECAAFFSKSSICFAIVSLSHFVFLCQNFGNKSIGFIRVYSFRYKKGAPMSRFAGMERLFLSRLYCFGQYWGEVKPL